MLYNISGSAGQEYFHRLVLDNKIKKSGLFGTVKYSVCKISVLQRPPLFRGADKSIRDEHFTSTGAPEVSPVWLFHYLKANYERQQMEKQYQREVNMLQKVVRTVGKYKVA